METLLRPQPHRGDQLAAGVVVLTTLVALVGIRFEEEWGTGVHLVYTGLAFLWVTALAAMSPREDQAPRPYQSVLFVAGFVLALSTLDYVAQVLGVDETFSSSGTMVWIGLLLTLYAGYFATRRDSAICTLLAAVAGGLTVLVFIDWVFDPDDASTFRWVLLALIAAYAFAAITQRDRRPRHGVSLVDAAGLACLTIALTFAVQALVAGFAGAFGGEEEVRVSVGWGWELVVLAVGFGLVAYSAIDRAPGPGYLGVANLLAFLLIAGEPGDDGPSLIGWPLVLVLGAGAMLALALRPSRPLPPAPDADRPDAPTTPLPPA